MRLWAAVLISLMVVPTALSVVPGVALEPESQDEPRALATEALPRGKPLVDTTGPPWVPSKDAPAAAPGGKVMEFVCPGRNDGAFVPVAVTLNMVYTCPRRIYDNTVGGNRGWLMGNMDLAIHPDDPNVLGFVSMHGDATDAGPRNHSRVGLTHSLYGSVDLGNTFGDQWTDTSSNGGIYGDEAAIALDADGNVYVAYSWAMPQGDGFEHIVRAWKGDHMNEARNNMMQSYDSGNHYEVWGRDVSNNITELHMVYVPVPPPEQNSTDNETHPPGQIGDATIEFEGDEFIAMTYHEQAFQGWSETMEMSAWIDVHWTDTGPGNSIDRWNHLSKEELIGPCRDASNPVVWEGRVYVACTVDAGYDARRSARVGDVDIWSVELENGTKRFESHANINGDHPRLAINANGYMAVVTTRVLDEDRVDIRASLGWYGKSWNTQWQFGELIHREMGDQPILDAHVTGLALSDTDNTAFAIYKEWNALEDEEVDPNNPPQPDPEELRLRMKGYSKFLFSFHECEAPIAGAHFAVGDAYMEINGDAYQNENLQNYPGVFNEPRDGIQTVWFGNEELAFFAVGDYGAGQFGAVRVNSALSDSLCVFVPPPPLVLPVPAPLAAGLASQYSALVGSTVGAASLAGIGYLLAVKRKNPFLAAAKAK